MIEALVIPISETDTDHFDIVYTGMPAQISLLQLPVDWPRFLVLGVK